MTEPWFLNPELLAEIEISKNEKGAYRVRSHPLDAPKHAKSEEIIRQIVLAQLRCHYHYPQDLLSQEHIIQMGIAKKRADIVVLGENSKTNAIIEVKLKFDENAVSQLQSYMMASGARFGAVIALDRRKVFRRNDGGDFVEIPDLPIHNCDMHLMDNNYRVMPATLKSRAMIDSLGIKSLLKISSTKSELIFQKGSIIISDAALLSYNLVRKAAISKGIFLSSAISNNEWDAILEILVEEQVPENQVIKWAKKEDVFFDKFFKENYKYESDGPASTTIFKKFYERFSLWYRNNVDPSGKFIISKKEVGKRLRDKGLVVRNKGGGTVIIGSLKLLDIR